jgi:hypothetical protein
VYAPRPLPPLVTEEAERCPVSLTDEAALVAAWDEVLP